MFIDVPQPPIIVTEGILIAHHCPKNSRDCFPHDRVGTGFIGDIAYTLPMFIRSEDGRGSGR